MNQKFTAKSIPQLHGKDTRKPFYLRRSDLVFRKFSSFKHFRSKRQNIYLHVSCPQAVLADSLLTIDTKSPDQYVTQQLTATTTHELFKPLIAPSLVAVVKPPIVPSVAAVVKSPMT